MLVKRRKESISRCNSTSLSLALSPSNRAIAALFFLLSYCLIYTYCERLYLERGVRISTCNELLIRITMRCNALHACIHNADLVYTKWKTRQLIRNADTFTFGRADEIKIEIAFAISSSSIRIDWDTLVVNTISIMLISRYFLSRHISVPYFQWSLPLTLIRQWRYSFIVESLTLISVLT